MPGELVLVTLVGHLRISTSLAVNDIGGFDSTASFITISMENLGCQFFLLTLSVDQDSPEAPTKTP